MLDQLDELYRDVILDHFKHSTHAGEIPEAQIKVTGANPLCGDELILHVKLQGDRVAQARFSGKGCAISQAAASMLTQTIEGKTRAETGRLIEALKGLMQGRDPDPAVDLGDLEALAGVRKFPVRVKCAALSWNVLEQGLASQGQKSEVRPPKSADRGPRTPDLGT